MARATLTPPPGIARNATPEATPGRWFDANNIRWRGGVIVPVGGNVELPGSAVTDRPRDIITWHDNAYMRWAAFGTDTKLYAYSFDDAVVYDITPLAGGGPILPPGYPSGYGLGDYGEGVYGISSAGPVTPPGIITDPADWWSMDTFGELLVVVATQDGVLYSWDPNTPTVHAIAVPNAPGANKGVIVTDQRQVVLYGAGGDPRRVAWSAQEDMTAWTPSLLNLAGDKQLVTTAASMTACKVSQGVLIFTTNDVHLMQYVGPPYAYGITQVGTGCGPISPRGVVTAGSFVAWMSFQNFWMFNGNVQPLPCELKDFFFAVLNPGSAPRLFGTPNPQFSEIWWDFPDETTPDGENNRYIALNYTVAQSFHWILGKRRRTAGDRSGTMDFPVLGGGTDTTGRLYQHETGYTDNGEPRAPNGDVYVESGNITLGEGDSRYHVRQVVFDASTNPELTPPFGFRFFAKEQPYDTVERTSGLCTKLHNGLMDTRISGRSIRVRLEATSDAPFRVGRTRLDVVKGGRR